MFYIYRNMPSFKYSFSSSKNKICFWRHSIDGIIGSYLVKLDVVDGSHLEQNSWYDRFIQLLYLSGIHTFSYVGWSILALFQNSVNNYIYLALCKHQIVWTVIDQYYFNMCICCCYEECAKITIYNSKDNYWLHLGPECL